MPQNASATAIRIAANPLLENATLNALMERSGHFRRFGVEVAQVEARGIAGPFDAIARGEADICMVSGYSQVIPRIAQGAPLRVVGSGMRKPALAVYARPERVASLAELRGKTVAVGPANGLLHGLTVRLLAEAGVDPGAVRFIDAGRNADCFRAVVEGKADACCAGVAQLGTAAGVSVVPGGALWLALPDHVFQLAYASCTAIETSREGLVAVLAAFGALYEDLMASASPEAFFEARRIAQSPFDEASARASWDFITRERPYRADLSLSEAEVDALQALAVGLGTMERVLPFAQVADMSLAAEAARRLRG